MTSSTGGQKGKKLARFSLVPAEAMKEVAEVYGRGAEKYDSWNWAKGYDWSLSLDALERHVNAFKAGELRDELGNHHLACVVFHALTLITFERHNLGKDDRGIFNGRFSRPTSSDLPAIGGSGHGEHVLGDPPKPVLVRSKSALWAERIRPSLPPDEGGSSLPTGGRGQESLSQGEEDIPGSERAPNWSSGSE